jgi:hypothetical protein
MIVEGPRISEVSSFFHHPNVYHSFSGASITGIFAQ